MPMPKDIGVIDLMMSIPISNDNAEYYEFLKSRLRRDEVAPTHPLIQARAGIRESFYLTQNT